MLGRGWRKALRFSALLSGQQIGATQQAQATICRPRIKLVVAVAAQRADTAFPRGETVQESQELVPIHFLTAENGTDQKDGLVLYSLPGALCERTRH